MSTYGCVLVGRNDNYGGNLVERAIYSINSCLETYDEVIYVDWNSFDTTLLDVIKPNLLKTGKLRYITVNHNEHIEFTKHFIGAQPCSEVFGRNVGLRRLSTDFLISTNIDEITTPREFLESLVDKDTMIIVARRGVTLQMVKEIGGYQDIKKIRDVLLTRTLNQAWPVTRESYSLVEWCGDLQIAHRDLWFDIKAFEETQLGRGVHDSFVQRKAVEFGYKTVVSYDIPTWHIDHNNSSNYQDGKETVSTSPDCLYGDFIGTINSENWGLSDYKFRTETI